VGVEQQRQHIRVSYQAPALLCSAGRPASSGNSFVSSVNAAVAVLVERVYLPVLFRQQ
jgi:hypothetical protein